MEPVRSLAVKGLIEGLVLHAIEREPTHGYGILKDLEAALGERPSKNRVYPLLRDLEEEGFVTSEPAEDDKTKQIYRLTEAGQARLNEYRALPRPFKDWVASVFGLPHLEDGGPEPEPTTEPEPEEAPPEPTDGADRTGSSWVRLQLDQLPTGPPVQAPHAEISIERSPREGRWSLTVDRHEPGSYPDADECPLTFLYLATQRLLLEAPLEE